MRGRMWGRDTPMKMASESGGHLAQEAKDQRTPANDLSVQVGAKGVVA